MMGVIKMKENIKRFNQLVEWFKESKFKDIIRVSDETPIYDYAVIDSKTYNISLGFCNKHNPNDINSSYLYINGRVAIDLYDEFDKYSKCPFYVFLPKTKDEFDGLLELIEFMITDYKNLDYDIRHDVFEKMMDSKFNSIKHLFDWNL